MRTRMKDISSQRKLQQDKAAGSLQVKLFRCHCHKSTAKR
jgi:hypothetical protein